MYRVKKYNEFQITAKNDHILTVRMGEFLNFYPPHERTSEEAVLVEYYEKCVKHKRPVLEGEKQSAAEILVKLENSYVRDYGIELSDLGVN